MVAGRSVSPRRNHGWELSKEQIAKLDAASEVGLAYPYWHQRQFEERNPKPV
jgi:hypothetical protein